MAAKKSTAVAVKKGTSVVTWEEKLKRYAEDAVAQEESVQTGNFISFKAGVIAYQGNPVSNNKLQAVILDSVLENCFYDTDYDEDDPQPPVCYAFARDDKDMKPHENSSKPQAESCAVCPHNKFGSAPNGKGKACANRRRIGMLPGQPLNKEVLEKSNFALAKLPVMSVGNWAGYVRALKGLQNRPSMAVLTEISTVPDTKSQFRVVFNHLLNLKDELLDVVDKRMPEVREALIAPYPEPSELPAKAKKGKPAPAKKRKF
jgi:hypothetical protein